MRRIMCINVCRYMCFFFCKQKTAYEMRISDWSSDVCSTDLNKKIDQRKINHVARLGGNWYCQVNEQNLFQVEKPNTQLGIGIDALPDSIRNSFILSRSEERRVGKECVSTCRSRWSTYH